MDALFLPFVLAFGAVFGLAVSMSYRSFAAGRRAWELFAVKHGLTLHGSLFSPVLEGRYAGVAIKVELVRRGGGRNNNLYTRYRVSIGVLMPPGFHVRKEGLLHLLGKVVGIGEDIQVGNPELDDALMITGDDMVRIIRLMSIPEVGAAVLGMVITHPQIEIGQCIIVEQRGRNETAQIEAMLDALCELVRTLEAGMQRLVAEDGRDPTPAVVR